MRKYQRENEYYAYLTNSIRKDIARPPGFFEEACLTRICTDDERGMDSAKAYAGIKVSRH